MLEGKLSLYDYLLSSYFLHKKEIIIIRILIVLSNVVLLMCNNVNCNKFTDLFISRYL